ncbi:MAG: 30S ribosomal protein S16 [Candidatus Aminicenantes bacterium]|nr:30S ribosomal protein S16 [Candidatus Aminicenantes bacterium]
MVVIRLRRHGAKKQPFYRIVVTDSRKPRESKAKETIGYYNPIQDPPEINIDLERAKYWMNKGAQASDTVRSLLNKVSNSGKQSDKQA